MITVIFKGWEFLRKYILTIPRFDLFLQGALLIVVFLESNAFLLLRRNDRSGFLPTVNEDWVKLGVGGAEFLLGALLAWQGRMWRHLTLSMWLGATAVSGLIILAFPFPEASIPTVELCNGGSISLYSEVTDDHATARGVFIVVTLVFCALTKISIWAHGITYLDDHEPENGPYFYGILISIRLSLGLSGSNWLRTSSVQDNWWEAQVTLSALTLMFSILFTLFPRQMPTYKEVDIPERTCISEPLGRVLRNKPLMLQCLALSLLTTAIFGYINYDTAFLQTKFHVETIRQDLRTSRVITDIFRSLVIIFFVSVFRMRFSCRRSDGVKATTAGKVGGVTAVFVGIFLAVLAGLSCGTGSMAGLQQEYQQPECSINCGCQAESSWFSPVCGLDTKMTYFSPCHAGCTQYEDLNGFLLLRNCSCGDVRAVRGDCHLPSCALLYNIYLVFFSVMLAVGASSMLMQGMVVLRSTRRNDKPLAVGVSLSVVGLGSNVLGHLLYKFINDSTCAYSRGGVCVFHQDTVWVLPAAGVALCLLSALLSIVATRGHTQHVVS